MANIGNLDRFARVIVGAVLIVLPFLLGWAVWLAIASVAVGVVLITTALFGFCPIYWALRLNTRTTSGA